MTLSEIIRRVGKPIAFYPWIGKLVGIKPALMICQLLYWTERASNERGDGWIYKSVAEMEDETCLTYREQVFIREELKRQGVLESQYERSTHRLWLRVNCEALDKLSGGHLTESKMPPNEMSDGISPEVRSLNGTESTTEITQKKGAINRGENKPKRKPPLCGQCGGCGWVQAENGARRCAVCSPGGGEKRREA